MKSAIVLPSIWMAARLGHHLKSHRKYREILHAITRVRRTLSCRRERNGITGRSAPACERQPRRGGMCASCTTFAFMQIHKGCARRAREERPRGWMSARAAHAPLRRWSRVRLIRSNFAALAHPHPRKIRSTSLRAASFRVAQHSNCPHVTPASQPAYRDGICRLLVAGAAPPSTPRTPSVVATIVIRSESR